VVGYVEAVTGIGLILGPIFGNSLYTLCGFDICFYIIGAFICLMSVVFKYFYPVKETLISDLLSENPETRNPIPAFSVGSGAAIDVMSNNHSSEKDNNSENMPSSANKVTYCKLLTHTRFTMAALTASLCYLMLCFMEPILQMRMLEMKLDQTQVGYFFMIMPFFTIPGSFVMLCLPKWMEKRVVIIVTLLCCSISFFICGPSGLLNWPESIPLMAVG